MSVFGRFTEESQKAILYAQNEARAAKHSYIGSEHILLGIAKEKESRGAKVLYSLGLTYETLKMSVFEIVSPGSEQVNSNLIYTPRTKKIFELAFEAAKDEEETLVGTDHILLGMIREAQGVGALVLGRLGVDMRALEQSVMNFQFDDEDYEEEEENTALGKYTVNLNQKAEDGKLDPIVGREKEISRVIQVLSRRRKNNPVLIGDPGVGKTAIAEGLAQKIVDGEVPEIIEDKIIRTLDVSGLIAGAKYRGDFEERLKDVISEAIEDEDTILFIDEMHVVIGAGAAEGAMDASNILKPMLTRGELQIIGATTTNEYRKHIEKDPAFERRLMPIAIEEPTVEDSIKILNGLKDKYEEHHNVEITDEAIDAAVKLSSRYLTDRFLPDKAIDLIDEASSKVKILSYKTLDFKPEFEDKFRKLNEEKQKAVDTQDFEKAASIRDQEKKLEEEFEKLVEEHKKSQVKEKIVYENIAEIVTEWSKVPVTKIDDSESKKLLNLEKNIKNIVVGQDKAVESLTKSIKRARMGLKNPNKPMGSFIFVGPTGVGKTYLAKTLAKELFGSEENMLRIDMTEYMEKHSVSKLVGSPPGYVGYDEGGQLTDAVRSNPYTVVLFDEIEKAHPDVFNILLQILDDGRLTDSKGRVVSFKDTVIVMTSNAGAKDMKNKTTIGFSSSKSNEKKQEYDKIKSIVNEALKSAFKPEFLNRLDEVIVFNELGQKEIQNIVKLMLEQLKGRLGEIGYNVKFTDKLAKYISNKGFDSEFGARPLQRAITNNIEDELAELMLKGEITKDAAWEIDFNRKLQVKKLRGVKHEEKNHIQV